MPFVFYGTEYELTEKLYSIPFCVYYTPKSKSIDPKHIPWKLIYAYTVEQALSKFNAQYPDCRVLYTRKFWNY